MESGKLSSGTVQTRQRMRPQKSCLPGAGKIANLSEKSDQAASQKKISNMKGDPNMLMKTNVEILTKSVKPICV